MGKVRYTDEQKKVINLRDANILVSAAAGSGKTAVLTERIISLITDEENPLDIDRLLVVTFTKAAAAEMRERIGKAIHKKLEEDPDNSGLLRQITLLHNAQITTIDSFCLFVIRNNFGDIGLDPAFRIMDEGERKLLMKDTLDELMEERYQDEKNKDFFRLVECYGENGQDKKIEEMVLSVYQFAMSHPYPEEWLDLAEKGYEEENFEELEQNPWWERKKEETERLIDKGLAISRKAVEYCQEPSGPESYLNTVKAQQMLLTELKKAKGFDERYNLIRSADIPPLSRAGKTVDEELKNRVKICRDRIADLIKRLKTEYYYDISEHILAAHQEIRETAGDLICLVRDFMDRFAQVKREKSVIDFVDMEHFALDILLHKDENGNRVPSRAAKEYRDYFSCVMVDEYQDSNYVQEYILRSVAREDNYFMVGDIKQSIYRFRQARPEIFMEKYSSFQEEGINVRIDLNRNFRSREEVIDSVNDVFYKIMTKDSAGMDYDKSSQLYKGIDLPAASGQDYNTELVLIEKTRDTELAEGVENSKELEALYVAGRIKDMMSRTFMVVDSQSGQLRNLSYGDIVILIRTADGYDESFRKTLEAQGIPAYADIKAGYFSTQEVRTVMNVLQVLDNPRQDLPLYGMMTSYIGGFSDEEVALIKAGGGRGCLYDALCTLTEPLNEMSRENNGTPDTPEKERLQKKAKAFTDWLDSYRKIAEYTVIRELIEKIINETGYLDYVTALPGGNRRRANLMLLLERATDFEATSYYGLFHFVRYVNQLKEQEVDYGEAGILDEHADVVRIMTIHKSKGLEFPVCFLSGLGKQINKKDSTGTVLMDSEYGIGLDNINPVKRIERPGIKKKIMAGKIGADSIAEEMRVLYVAMTRAKEKLIMTGVIRSFGKFQEKMQLREEADADDLLQSTTYLDFLMPAYAKQSEPYICCKSSAEIMEHMAVMDIKTLVNREALEKMELQCDLKLCETLEKRFTDRYPYPELAGLYTKTTVSELKKAAYEDPAAHPVFETDNREAYIPAFMRKEEKTSAGTKRGTAVHRIMELIEYKDILALTERDENLPQKKTKDLETYVKASIEKAVKSGKLSAEEAELINIAKCVHFLESPLAKRMMNADRVGKLYKEKSFFIGIPAQEMEDHFPTGETVLVQGVVDVFLEEEDGLVLADYKTDRVTTEKELTDRYHLQLEIYARALRQITGKRVKEKIIYSFALEREICL